MEISPNWTFTAIFENRYNQKRVRQNPETLDKAYSDVPAHDKKANFRRRNQKQAAIISIL